MRDWKTMTRPAMMGDGVKYKSHPHKTGVMTVKKTDKERHTEDALRKSETHYRELLDLAIDGILLGSHEGMIIEANKHLCTITGVAQEDMLGRHISALPFTKECLDKSPFRFDLLQKGKTVVSERTLIRPDGSEVSVEMRTKMMPDGTYQSIFRDITERKQQEEELRLKNLVFDVSIAANSIADIEGIIIEANDAFLHIWGYPDKEEVIGKPIHHFLNNQAEAIAIVTALDKTDKWEGEYTAKRKDGTAFIAHGIATILKDKNGKRVGYQSAVMDITERKRTEEALQNFTATLETRVEAYTREIQSSNISLLETTARLRDLAEEVIQAEERERKRLATILHDDLQQLLVAAKMKTHRIASDADIPLMRLEIIELLEKSIGVSRNIVMDLSPPILWDGGLMMGLSWLCRWMRENHGLTVEVKGPEDCETSEPINILIFRAVRELLFNVVKHAGVNRASVEMDQPSANLLRIVVRDQGCGFPPNISEKFGLFRLRERIAYIGGTIEVESASKQGTRISFTVPLNPSTPLQDAYVSGDIIEPSPSSDPGLIKYRVLVVDDHEMLRHGLMELLDKENDITVIGVAEDGKQAVQQTRMLHPDIVLMDISMPKMNGIEATRIIMDEMPETCVIGLSMHDQAEMRRAMHEAGAAAYLCKGEPIEDLITTIRRFPPVRK